jgi:hypothetical protein
LRPGALERGFLLIRREVAVEGWRPVEDLVRLLEAAPGEPMLVWCGNDATVNFGGEPQPWVRELLASMADILAAHGGTAGILCDQAPPPLCGRAGVDALVVSTDNELTEDPVNENRA